MGKRSELSDCELLTMKCIWDADEPVTASEVIAKLKDDYGLAYKDTTVYTFIQKLKDKGFVESNRRGLTFFSPKRNKLEFRDQQLKEAEKFWFNGSSYEMMAAFIQISHLNDEEKQQIKKLIDEN
jgi:predicted transcriptional regulator